MRCALLGVLLVSSPSWAADPPQPVLTSNASQAIPETGRLLSFHADDSRSPDYQLVIARITKKGIVTLSRTHVEYLGTESWLDAKTLVNVSLSDTTAKLSYFVDGIAAPTRAKTLQLDWKLRSGEEIHGSDAHHTRAGAIWLRGCLSGWEYGQDGNECNKTVWMRIDTATPTVTRKTPPALLRMGSNPFRAPSIKAPTSHVVEVAKVNVDGEKRSGVVCRTPTTRGAWSIDSQVDGELFKTKKVAWVLAKPPIFAVTGRSETAGGVSTATYYVRACEPTKLDWFAMFGGGVWALREHGSLTLSVRADPIAVMFGSELLLAP